LQHFRRPYLAYDDQADFQSLQTRRNHTQRIRSAGMSFSRFGADRAHAELVPLGEVFHPQFH
jgi:hypothetical protein